MMHPSSSGIPKVFSAYISRILISLGISFSVLQASKFTCQATKPVIVQG